MSTNLLNMSKNLATRAADEHYSSFNGMLAAARHDRANSREVNTTLHSLRIVADGGRLKLTRNLPGSGAYELSYQGARALSRLAGADAAFVYERLSPEVAAAALNNALQNGEDRNVNIMLSTFRGDGSTDNTARVRAINGEAYARVWDADYLEAVDRWLIGTGWKAAQPTINTNEQRDNIMGNNKPALFRGDGDSAVFLMCDNAPSQPGAGNRPAFRGWLGTNSEVGLRSLSGTDFVFDAFCANFIIWGARAMRSLRLVHRGHGSLLIRKFEQQLQLVEPVVTFDELDVMRKANEHQFAADVEKIVERLQQEFALSEVKAQRVVALAAANENRDTRELSHAWVANGVTSLAKEVRNSDALIELGTLGGDIYMAGAR